MNRLADAMSPYLRQHADNPVDWRPWSQEALAEAKERDVPLFISIGYAACHWCHVMAHESFADETVAAVVNELTVPIKVDREERPDIDAVYMGATLALTGAGGWPMTVFALPDGSPFFAGTYLPKQHFLRLLDAVRQAWRDNRDDVAGQGQAIVQACAAAGPELADVSQSCPIDGPCPAGAPIDATVLDTAARAVLEAADRQHGGFGGAPKFPTVPTLDFLLRHYRRTGDSDSLRVVRHTAERMARGGIYDQLGGGFARYSVDAEWTVPHFEKMLYDNALLLGLYTELFRSTRDPLFGRVADETARFIVDDLGTPEGGLASALDADADGTEGSTYVWTPEQLREVLGDTDGDWAAGRFAVTPDGTFEAGASVLRLPADPDDAERFESVRRRLLAARRDRPQPERDNKVVAAWAGLAVAELTVYAAVRDADFAADAAERTARLLLDVHYADGRLHRVSRDGVAGAAAGILEDYAATAAAFLARHAAGSPGDWLTAARSLLDTVVIRFADGNGGFFDTADDAEALVHRPVDPTDGPTPSGWAQAAAVLFDFAAITGESEYRDDAYRALTATEPVIERHPRFAGGLAAVAETAMDVGGPAST